MGRVSEEEVEAAIPAACRAEFMGCDWPLCRDTEDCRHVAPIIRAALEAAARVRESKIAVLTGKEKSDE